MHKPSVGLNKDDALSKIAVDVAVASGDVGIADANVDVAFTVVVVCGLVELVTFPALLAPSSDGKAE